jgi:hypothetical protein
MSVVAEAVEEVSSNIIDNTVWNNMKSQYYR